MIDRCEGVRMRGDSFAEAVIDMSGAEIKIGGQDGDYAVIGGRRHGVWEQKERVADWVVWSDDYVDYMAPDYRSMSFVTRRSDCSVFVLMTGGELYKAGHVPLPVLDRLRDLPNLCGAPITIPRRGSSAYWAIANSLKMLGYDGQSKTKVPYPCPECARLYRYGGRWDHVHEVDVLPKGRSYGELGRMTVGWAVEVVSGARRAAQDDAVWSFFSGLPPAAVHALSGRSASCGVDVYRAACQVRFDKKAGRDVVSLYVTMPPVSRSKLYEPAQLWLERPRAGGLRWRSGA